MAARFLSLTKPRLSALYVRVVHLRWLLSDDCDVLVVWFCLLLQVSPWRLACCRWPTLAWRCSARR
jgi:hypothetical protein